ncbi:MAG: hypothetical protein HRT89_11145 [Lentisphaeria bacterium]|nr:hypothetical protein [Lentisphaeria bacterium]NQZ68610.1 hypothetical protein [Lentisphaeria bacterium]
MLRGIPGRPGFLGTFDESYFLAISFLYQRVPRNTQSPDYVGVLDLVRSGSLKLDDLVSEICNPEDAQDVYDRVLSGNIPGTCVFKWS